MDNNVKAGFLKVGNKEHMESLFYHGTVFMKPLNYFKHLEKSNLRSDKHEGLSYTIPSNGSILKIQKENEFIPIAEIQDSIAIRENSEKMKNIFCLHMVYRTQIYKNVPFDKYGDWYVFITDMIEFLNRLKKVGQEKGFSFLHGPVKYVDRKEYSGPMNHFMKYSDYASDQEFRITTEQNSDSTLIFNIGNISDIAILDKWIIL